MNCGARTQERFDLGLKVALAHRIRCGVRSNSLISDYLTHIYLWNGFVEPNTQKRGAEAFLATFTSIVDRIAKGGAYSLPPVPISPSGLVVNGAHRLAAGISCGINTIFEATNEPDVQLQFRILPKA